jgi:hypothetical protein
LDIMFIQGKARLSFKDTGSAGEIGQSGQQEVHTGHGFGMETGSGDAVTQKLEDLDSSCGFLYRVVNNFECGLRNSVGKADGPFDVCVTSSDTL